MHIGVLKGMPSRIGVIARRTRAVAPLFALICGCLLLISASQNPSNSLQGLLITEVYYDTPGTDAEEEWIELVNLSDSWIDLSGFKIGDEEERGGGEGMMMFPQGASVAPSEIIVIAQTASGFESLFGLMPDYEIQDSSAVVPDLRSYSWSTGDIRLANDGDEVLILDEMDRMIDIVTFGDSTFYDTDQFAGPAVRGVFRGQSIDRVPGHCDSNSAADWQPSQKPSPWQITSIGVCQHSAEVAPLAAIPIGHIQSEGKTSPYTNLLVSIEGIVTGVREDQNEQGAVFYSFFVQDLPGTDDGNPLTSDGIAIFTGIEKPPVSTGDVVSSQGAVTEYFGLTEIDDKNLSIAVRSRGNPLPEPVILNPPSERIRSQVYLEQYEGMLVALPSAVVVGPAHKGCGFEVVREDLGIDQINHSLNATQLGRVIHVLHPTDVDCREIPIVNSGDIVSDLVGPLSFEFEEFRLVYQDPDRLTVDAKTPSIDWQTPSITAGQVSIISFNMDDFFGVLERSEEPESVTYAIHDARMMKFVHLIGQLLDCPTIIGIQEVGDEQLLTGLAQSLEPACGFVYEISHVDSSDQRGIDVALMTDPRRIVVDEFTLQQACTDIHTGIEQGETSCPEGTHPLFSRPPLQAHLAIDEEFFTIFVNHFKSKRGGDVETAPIRANQAIHLSNLIVVSRTDQSNEPVIVLGDFNDYADSTAMEILTADAGMIDVLGLVSAARRYSYIFGGQRQLVDWILVSPDLAARISRADILHVNADYAENLKLDISPQFLPVRSSDHDIPLLILEPGDSISDTHYIGNLIVEFVETLLTEMGQVSTTEILRGCLTLFTELVRGILLS